MNKIVEITHLEQRLQELEAKLLAMGIKGDDGKDGADGKDGNKGDRGLRGLKGKDGLNSPGGSSWIPAVLRGGEAATLNAQSGKKWEAVTLVFRVYQASYAHPVIHLPRAMIEAGAGTFQVSGMSDGSDVFYGRVEIVEYNDSSIRIKLADVGYFTNGRFNSRKNNNSYRMFGAALSY